MRSVKKKKKKRQREIDKTYQKRELSKGLQWKQHKENAVRIEVDVICCQKRERFEIGIVAKKPNDCALLEEALLKRRTDTHAIIEVEVIKLSLIKAMENGWKNI
ncbi:hypothetical protein ACH5RR_041165 [Cinchona calisaya]|uniref:Uncharacterized protein n=1 Tax=Cinchona calisaya TaxID=153742 RepID=A0ABD2XTP0_9GENT